MRYSFIVDTETGAMRGICKRGTLDAIKAKEQGNLLDDCVERETAGTCKGRGWAWYLTPCASRWRFIVLDGAGKIEKVSDKEC